MNNYIKTLGLLGSFASWVTLCGTARADLQGGTYSSSATVSSWSGAPAYSTPLSGLSSQGQPGAGGGASYTVLSETFTPASPFTLGAIDVIASINAGTYTL